MVIGLMNTTIKLDVRRWVSSINYIDRCPVFFFNDTATTEIYTLSLHDALPISSGKALLHSLHQGLPREGVSPQADRDRKSTRLNSSHSQISYAVFCLKKKKTVTRSVSKHLVIRYLSVYYLPLDTLPRDDAYMSS